MWRKVKWIALSCTAVILCVIGYYGYSLYQFGTHIQEKKEEPFFTQFKAQNMSQQEEAPPKWEGKERVNILLLGADARGTSKNEAPRSDTIMIASVDPVTKKASLFSILRDTYVKIPGYGQDRINTAFAVGGPNLAMKTVGELLGLPIQYYVYTDFQGFMALVDAIGGIEIDVEKDMKYRDSEEPEFDINLKKGLQHMDGKTALQYVRFRHDALSDYSRTERQRKFLTAVAEEMQSTLSIIRLPSILNKIDPYITTNLSITDMIKLGSLGFEVKAQGVNGVQIPPSNLLEEDNIGGASVLTVNPSKLQKYVKEQLENQPGSTETTEQRGDGGSTTVQAPETGSGTGAVRNSSGAGQPEPVTNGNKTGGTSVPPKSNETTVKTTPPKSTTSGASTGSKTNTSNSGTSGSSNGTVKPGSPVSSGPSGGSNGTDSKPNDKADSAGQEANGKSSGGNGTGSATGSTNGGNGAGGSSNPANGGNGTSGPTGSANGGNAAGSSSGSANGGNGVSGSSGSTNGGNGTSGSTGSANGGNAAGSSSGSANGGNGASGSSGSANGGNGAGGSSGSANGGNGASGSSGSANGGNGAGGSSGSANGGNGAGGSSGSSNGGSGSSIKTDKLPTSL
ncbi:hypothetical protein GCM10020370_51280 [Paenibacillus hodogayensis]